jgi:hypothetical protein
VLQSFEPGEDWFFDYRSGEFFEGPALDRATVTRSTSPYRARPARSRPTGNGTLTSAVRSEPMLGK